MTKHEKLTLAISIGAIAISAVSLFSTLWTLEEAKLYVYEGEYNLESEFRAKMDIVLINSGDHDVLVSDLWLTVGKECSIDIDDVRIQPVEKMPLSSRKGNLSIGQYKFVGPSVPTGTHEVCLYAETVSSRRGTEDHIVGADTLVVDAEDGPGIILNPNTKRWKRVWPLFSERGIDL